MWQEVCPGAGILPQGRLSGEREMEKEPEGETLAGLWAQKGQPREES